MPLAACIQNVRVDSTAIVAHHDPKIPACILYFYFYRIRFRMQKCIDEGLAADPSPWSVVADALDEIVRDLGGPVDAATLAGLTQRLFPDDHARSVDVRDQLATLRDDELRAIPDVTIAG